MKSLNIKIPFSVAKLLDDNAQLNPSFITDFIVSHIHLAEEIKDSPINEMSYQYVFKLPSEVHKTTKLKSIDLDIPMNEIIGRLLVKYY